MSWSAGGQLLSMTYPTGRMVTTVLDGAGRVAGLSGVQSGAAKSYVSGVSYAAHGGPVSVTTGSAATSDALALSWNYDSRLRMTGVSAGGLMTLSFQLLISLETDRRFQGKAITDFS